MSNYLRKNALACGLAALCAQPVQALDQRWSHVAVPTQGVAETIGAYNAGCLRGAMTLPLVGEGYQRMRPSRQRHYGHPALIAFIERLGRDTASLGQRVLIGDMGQARGGPTLTGHRSHQSGLDVDIWFLQQPRNRVLSPTDTEQLSAPSMINAKEGTVDRGHWSVRERDLLKRAAEAPEVERIFVNAIIKQALCESEPANNRAWLTKIRPWWGHDAHLHVRLACPKDSPQCQPQKPLPSGDGCDTDLIKWVKEIWEAALSLKPPKQSEPPAPVHLPDACETVLQSP